MAKKSLTPSILNRRLSIQRVKVFGRLPLTQYIQKSLSKTQFNSRRTTPEIQRRNNVQRSQYLGGRIETSPSNFQQFKKLICQDLANNSSGRLKMSRKLDAKIHEEIDLCNVIERSSFFNNENSDNKSSYLVDFQSRGTQKRNHHRRKSSMPEEILDERGPCNQNDKFQYAKNKIQDRIFKAGGFT